MTRKRLFLGIVLSAASASGALAQETGAFGNAAVQAVLIAAGVVIVAMAGPVGIVAVVTTVLAALASVAIVRRTRQGEAVHRDWMGYKKAFSSTQERSVQRDPVDRHLIYSIHTLNATGTAVFGDAAGVSGGGATAGSAGGGTSGGAG